MTPYKNLALLLVVAAVFYCGVAHAEDDVAAGPAAVADEPQPIIPAAAATTTTEVVAVEPQATATEDITGGIAAAAVAACTWPGHCLGDPCKTYNDCDQNWICVSGKCAVPGTTAPPPTTTPTPPPTTTTGSKTTMTSYNVMSFDNTYPGDLYVGRVSQKFVNNVNIVAVHSKYWATYGKTQVDITYLGKTARFVVLDLCADTDCGGCCTANLNWNNNGFLLDVDSSAARRVWGIVNAENTLKVSATYKPVANSKVDFAALKAKYP